jgi:hypothetical protein
MESAWPSGLLAEHRDNFAFSRCPGYWIILVWITDHRHAWERFTFIFAELERDWTLRNDFES